MKSDRGNQVDRVEQVSDHRRIKNFLFHLCLMVLAQSMIVSGYLNSINTTIERRYKLTSREIGLIYMSYEFSCIPTTIALSVVGHKFNRPRLLGACGIVMALGMFIFSLPHFVGSSYTLVVCNDNTSGILCNTNILVSDKDCSRTNNDTWALFIFCLSQLIIGVGASPIYLLGPSYLWDHLSIKTYSAYSSVFYTCSGLGPPIGFLLGGIFLGIYIDVPMYSKCDNIDNTHALWLGAWWIGLVVVASITVVVVVPLLYFPKDLSKKKKPVGHILILQDKSMFENNICGDEVSKSPFTACGRSESTGAIGRFKRLPSNNWIKFISDSTAELKKLFSNTLWFLISFTTVMEQSVAQGCTTFVSKYLQVVFNVPANYASYVVGGIVVPAAIAGVAFGGLIMNRLQPNISTAIKMLIFIIASSGVMVFILMFLSCDDLHVTGVSIGYSNVKLTTKYDLQSACNSHCHCVMENYQPVCDTKGARNFYSPCHAGCRSISNASNRNLTYTNCTCTLNTALVVGKCSPKCPTYYISLAVVFVMVFLTAMGQIPINIITLSSVGSNQSSIALGVQVFMVRLFAFIPAPLYFGALFDFACLVRIVDRCNKGSICREYNLYLLPFIWLGAITGIKLLSFLLCLSAYVFAKKEQIKNIRRTNPIKVNNLIIEVRSSDYGKNVPTPLSVKE